MSEFYFRKPRLPAPLGLLAGLLAARGIPPREKLAAVGFVLFLKTRSFRLEHDIPVDELLRQHRQDGRIGHYLWRPLCVSALNTPSAQASSNAFLAALRDTHLRAAVQDLHQFRKPYGAVIVAVGPHQLKNLLPELAPDYTYQPIHTCYLQYGAAVKLPFPMLGLAGGLVQWAFDRGALTGEKGLLAAVISAQGDHQQMSQDELAETCHRELAQENLVSEKPLWARVIAEKRATATCSPGMKRPDTATRFPGILLAGD